MLAMAGIPTRHIPLVLAKKLGEEKPIAEKTLLKRYRRQLDEGLASQAVETCTQLMSAIRRGEGWAIKFWFAVKGGPDWQYPREPRDPEVDPESLLMGQRPGSGAPSPVPDPSVVATQEATPSSVVSQEDAMRDYLALMRPRAKSEPSSATALLPGPSAQQ